MLARIAFKASCSLLFILLCFTTKAQLHPDFSATSTTQCAPAIIQFTDSTTGNPSAWQWDLGNGTTSFLQNPSATYFNPGTYTVKLIVKNSLGVDSVTKTNYITVNALPSVKFISSATTGCYPLDIQFLDQSIAGSGITSKWEWDFGDGITSNLQNPVHTYDNAGNYNVTLRITNSNGCTKTLSKSQYIIITSGVHAKFTNSSLNTCKPPAIINFTNTSTGTGTLSYQWSFGDGGTSTSANPTHTYTKTGSYTVQLITSNTTGCSDTLTISNAISLGSVDASMSSIDSVCANIPIKFTNTSVPAASSSLWNFGDGSTSTITNPSKAYTNGGTYTVKLLANFGACKDSASKTVVIAPKPRAVFVGDDTISCQAPLTVNFTNTSVNAVSYKWNFGDGFSATSQNASHIYTKTGSFDVSLIVTSASGCSDTLIRKAYIQIQPPKITLTNLPDSGCAPFTKTFGSKISSVDSVTGYVWDFGDGTTSTLLAPTHTFSTAGSYTIKLTITTLGGCSSTATVVNGVIASTIPTSNFSADPTNTCAKTLVNFTDLSTGNATHWLWSFGDGSTSTIHNPSHIYNDTGYFDIQLVAWNRGCPDTLKMQDYIHINPPIAKFVISNDCKKPFDRIFTDKSVGADEWNWDFGDGTTSTTKSPMHTYADTGTYTVTLFVRNYTSGCDFTTTKTLKIVLAKANFYSSDTIICKGNTIALTDPQGYPGNVTSYVWNFGDGTGTPTTTVNNITHAYKTSGSYTDQLIITDVIGCKDTLIKIRYIRVNGPTAKFGVPSSGKCLNNAINFTDSSTTDGTHPIITWIWKYGDGKIDTLTGGPFQHTYTSTGSYAVSLKTIDNQGCADSFTLSSPLLISKPMASFYSNDTLSCPGIAIKFADMSWGTGLSYVWNFGDGTNSNSLNPAHNYSTDGSYTIKLLVTDMYGCTDSTAKSNYISIKTPVANFDMSDSVSTCPPLLVHFTNLSASADSIKWDFGDGSTSAIANPTHFYTYPGVYTVTMSVVSTGGCTSVLQRKITIQGPTGTFVYTPLTGCDPVKIDFTATAQNTSSYIWDFNDGTTVNSNSAAISHAYTHTGSYLPKVILSDSKGCHVPIIGTDTIKVYRVDTKFGFSTKAMCDSGSVIFTDSSTSNDSISNFAWDFGDGGISSVQNPSHNFTQSGTYYPKLVVTSKIGCTDTLVSPTPVKIVASPQAGITATGNGCTPLNATFNGLLLAPDTSAISWNWNFGNGTTSSLQNPTQQTYSKSGVYIVQLKILNSTGCQDTVSKTIEAYVIPSVDAGGDATVCQGKGTTLSASGANTYSWSPATGLNCTNCASPVASPVNETKYFVQGTSLYGCTATDSVDIKVKSPFVMRYSLPDSVCKGSTTRVFADGASTYVWRPAAGLSSTTLPNPEAKPDTTTNYTVIGTDDVGCFSDTGHVLIKVFPVPTVYAGGDKTINVGQTIDLVPVISKDVTNVVWSPTGNISRNFYPGITVKPTQTTEYTVKVSNDGGCKASDKATIYVVCNGANIFMPNTFSPNGDGVNDVYYPRGTGLFRIKTLRMFTRWGEVIFENHDFEANNASAGWDGTFKGKKLTSDVYVYTLEVICDNNSVLTFNGNVALIQ